MIRSNPNRRIQGDEGVAIAIAWFATHGYRVFVPLGEAQKYDLVVDGENGLERVQVKTSTRQLPSGAYDVRLETTGGNKSGTGVVHKLDGKASDLLFVVTPSGMYLFESAELDRRARIAVGNTHKNQEIFMHP